MKTKPSQGSTEYRFPVTVELEKDYLETRGQSSTSVRNVNHSKSKLREKRLISESVIYSTIIMMLSQD